MLLKKKVQKKKKKKKKTRKQVPNARFLKKGNRKLNAFPMHTVATGKIKI